MISWREQPPDFRRKDLGDLLRHLPFTSACVLALGGGIRPKIVVGESTRRGVWAHISERSVEMGGLLIGTVHVMPGTTGGFVIAVNDFVASECYEGTSVSLRMNSHVWDAARMRAKEGASVIGWYHSHPNLGAFFSGTDRRTQKAFFYHEHSLGLVIDPIRNEEAWFLGEQSAELDVTQVLYCHWNNNERDV